MGSTRGKSGKVTLRPKALRALVALVLLTSAVWALSLSPLFRISNVIIRGDYFSAPEFLTETLDPDKLGNIFLVSTKGLKGRLQKHPWIQDVRIKRRLPQTLEVYLTETHPVAALVTGKGFVLLNEKGLAIAKSDQLSPYSVPALTLEMPVPFQIGEELKIPGLKGALQILDQLSLAGLPISISEANLSPDLRLVLYCKGGSIIEWGSLERRQEKIDVLQVILSEGAADLDGAFLINLSNSTGPAVKF